MSDIRNEINLASEVIQLLKKHGFSVRASVPIGGTNIDGLISSFSADKRKVAIGVEVKYLASAIDRPYREVQQALYRLIALRSAGSLDGGFVVTNLDVAIPAMSLGPDVTSTTGRVPFRIYPLKKLENDLRRGAFEAEWREALQGVQQRTVADADHSLVGSESNLRKLFVCMEYNDHFDDVFNYGIASVAKRVAFTAERVKDHPSHGTMINDIQADLQSADLVVCDVTTGNPNVFYEVGYSHALQKSTILIAARGTEMPFNTRGYRHLLYRNISDLEQQLESEIKMMISEGTL